MSRLKGWQRELHRYLTEERKKQGQSQQAREHLACPQKGRKPGGWNRREHGQLEPVNNAFEPYKALGIYSA